MFARITTTDQLRTIADRYGSHYFTPNTLRYFSSRVHRTVYGERFFVTSEQYDDESPRLYSIRSFTIDAQRGRIDFDTVGEFQAYDTRREAHSAARTLARAMKHLSESEVQEAVAAAAECLMWSSLIVIDEEGTMIEADNTGLNWSADALEVIDAEMRSFLIVIEQDNALSSYAGLSAAQLGRDFILTRNGHGTGFWDRGLGYVGDRLTQWAKTFGSTDVYVTADGELGIL